MGQALYLFPLLDYTLQQAQFMNQVFDLVCVDNFLSDAGEIGTLLLTSTEANDPTGPFTEFFSSGTGANLASTDGGLIGPGGSIGFGFVQKFARLVGPGFITYAGIDSR